MLWRSLLRTLARELQLHVNLQAMKTVEKKGLQAMAREAGLDLYSLPYTDARPERQQWLAQQPIQPPQVSPTFTLQQSGFVAILCVPLCSGPVAPRQQAARLANCKCSSSSKTQSIRCQC